jgi:hypothetical protein
MVDKSKDEEIRTELKAFVLRLDCRFSTADLKKRQPLTDS